MTEEQERGRVSARRSSGEQAEQPVLGALDINYGYELEVDSQATSSDREPTISDTDSAIGSSFSRPGSITTSINSEIVNYRFENGRRYHAFAADSYYLPNDEDEADRLDLQHHVWRMTLDGALYAAPLSENIQDVLDVGTGSGIWAIEFAEEHPSAQILGTDLSAIQPDWVPPNCSFLIDDAESDWDFGGRKFDFIHARMLCLGLRNWSRFFAQAFENLKPGGWVEVQEVQLPVRCDDDSVPPGAPLQRWSDLIYEAAATGGIDTKAGYKFTDQLRETGFVNVKEEFIKWAIGTWPKGRKQKTIGRWTHENLSSGLQGMSMALLTRRLGWSREEVELFLIDVRKDISDKKRHYYWQMSNHFAQKPHEEEESHAE